MLCEGELNTAQLRGGDSGLLFRRLGEQQKQDLMFLAYALKYV